MFVRHEVRTYACLLCYIHHRRLAEEGIYKETHGKEILLRHE